MDSSSMTMVDQSVPAWEKEFCLKVGLFQWDEFVEAKKLIHEYQYIMVWDDSASKEAFNDAKERFKARSFALPYIPPTPLLFGLELWPNDLDYSNPEIKNKNDRESDIGVAEDGNSSWKKICQINNWTNWLVEIACSMCCGSRKSCMSQNS